ncbi:hypothetical protein ACFSOZ_20125 [Mesorhizobium newzealandense]|uniref:Uncharacterized protein n=1 Tax=Mesorhizobium newzealandense TaxID=1300302 RepID=A0ABW4UCU9_9HYPH
MLLNPAASDRGRIFVAGHPQLAFDPTAFAKAAMAFVKAVDDFLQNRFFGVKNPRRLLYSGKLR